MTTEPDGILKGYSNALGISLCWGDGRPRIYNPATGEYLRSAVEVRELLGQSEEAIETGREQLDRMEAELQEERVETRRLRERLRRLESGG